LQSDPADHQPSPSFAVDGCLFARGEELKTNDQQVRRAVRQLQQRREHSFAILLRGSIAHQRAKSCLSLSLSLSLDLDLDLALDLALALALAFITGLS
jgi:hypothetical protein